MKEALQQFKSQAMGDNLTEVIKDLKEKMYSFYQNLQKLNEKESQVFLLF